MAALRYNKFTVIVKNGVCNLSIFRERYGAKRKDKVKASDLSKTYFEFESPFGPSL